MSNKTATNELTHIAPALHHLAVPIDSLHLDETNPLDHSDADLDETTESLRLNGQVEPIIYNAREANRILAGNGRWMGGKRLGWEWIAGVAVDLDPDAATRLAITLNATARRAPWNEVRLAQLVKAAKAEGQPVPGVTDDDLAALVARAMLQGQIEAGLNATGDGKSTYRKLNDQHKLIRTVIYADELATFEQALLLTGKPNRGEAAIELARAYIRGLGNSGR
jgi:ParB-like chromosome segregation protein Spo0J